MERTEIIVVHSWAQSKDFGFGLADLTRGLVLSVTQGNAQSREAGAKFHLWNMRCHFQVLLVKRKKKFLVHNPQSNLGLSYTTVSKLPLMDAYYNCLSYNWYM